MGRLIIQVYARQLYFDNKDKINPGKEMPCSSVCVHVMSFQTCLKN